MREVCHLATDGLVWLSLSLGNIAIPCIATVHPHHLMVSPEQDPQGDD